MELAFRANPGSLQRVPPEPGRRGTPNGARSRPAASGLWAVPPCLEPAQAWPSLLYASAPSPASWDRRQERAFIYDKQACGLRRGAWAAGSAERWASPPRGNAPGGQALLRPVRSHRPIPAPAWPMESRSEGGDTP